MERISDFVERYGNACILSLPIVGLIVLCFI